MTKNFIFFLFTLLNLSVFSQCNESSLIVNQVRAQDTDPSIDWELAKHFAYLNPDCDQKNILVLHLVGSYDNPLNTTLFPSYAANNGFHAIGLKYPNSTAAQTACGSSTDNDCYENFRKEIIEGGDYSSAVDVDVINSVNNRLLKLLQYLNTNNPSQNWDNYYTGSTINWTNIIVSGHSQGGGHAAYIAKTHQVKRCLMFASPNDYSNNFSSPAPWLTGVSLSPDSIYFGFNHLDDDVVDFSDQFEIWNDLGMNSFGDSLNVDLTNHYSTSHQLYTTVPGPNANDKHSLMIRDEQVPLDAENKSFFEPVWEYMLDFEVGLSVIENNSQKINVFPNPAQNILNIEISNNSTYNLVSIYNLQGQKVFTKKLKFEDNSIQIEFLPEGIYIIKLELESVHYLKFSKLN
jgi:hypothetical protein